MQQWSATGRCTEDSRAATGNEDNQRNGTTIQAPLWWRHGAIPWEEEGTEDQKGEQQEKQRKTQRGGETTKGCKKVSAKHKKQTTSKSKQKASHMSERTVCTVCDGVYEEEGDDSPIRVECNGYEKWFHLHCTSIPPRQHARSEQVDWFCVCASHQTLSNLTEPTHSSEGWATRIERHPLWEEKVLVKRNMLLSRNDTLDRTSCQKQQNSPRKCHNVGSDTSEGCLTLWRYFLECWTADYRAAI